MISVLITFGDTNHLTNSFGGELMVYPVISVAVHLYLLGVPAL